MDKIKFHIENDDIFDFIMTSAYLKVYSYISSVYILYGYSQKSFQQTRRKKRKTVHNLVKVMFNFKNSVNNQYQSMLSTKNSYKIVIVIVTVIV